MNAIHIVTYHSAKGLEWPIVICTNLGWEPRPRDWEVTTVIDDSARLFDPNQPLANRRLRFWPWPFGQQKTGIPLLDRVEASELGLRSQRTAEQEELRLLYVGLRARAICLFCAGIRSTRPWWRARKPPGLLIKLMTLPDGSTLTSRRLC